jgi:predicted restriction endonuclease
MNATEEVIRERGLWTPEDDKPSKSFGFKSRGLAFIDFRVSSLKRRGRLVPEGRDKWCLSKHLSVAESMLPSDIMAPPDRIEAHVTRIIRDTAAASLLKRLYDYKCQICGLRIELMSGSYYIEVHHVRPLGGSHKGLDTQANMLVLCPNHHAMFDFGIPRFIAVDQISISGESYNLVCKHSLSSEVITYHNEHIHRRTA